MVLLSINMAGQQELARIFQKAPEQLTEVRAEMEQIGGVIRDRFAEVIRVEGAVPGEPKWAPLSEKWTVPEREKLGFGGRRPILVRTGGYRRSFQATAGPTSVTVGSDDIRDGMLQLGGKTGLGTFVPARPITARVRAAFEARNWREIVDIMRLGLIRRLRQAGLAPS